jgi:uncharacterized Zn finger protein (UPF0148 family)
MAEPTNNQQANKAKIVCPVCGKEFDTQEEHDKHHREVHSEDRIGQN